MISVFHAWPYGRFTVTQRNLRRKKLDRTNQRSNFLGHIFINRNNVRVPVQLRRESQPQHIKTQCFLKNRPISFHVNSTSVIILVKRSQLRFSSNETNKPLPVPVYSVSQIRFKFRNQFQLLPHLRGVVKLTVESSTISIDSNSRTSTTAVDTQH